MPSPDTHDSKSVTIFTAGPQPDTFINATRFDVLSYANSPAGVAVDLRPVGGQQTVSGGYADGDFISGFERVTGSSLGDLLIGNRAGNFLSGGDGDDTIDGRGGNDRIRGDEGADILTGGSGVDTLVFWKSSEGVTIDLRADENGKQSASGGHAEGDIIAGFEKVWGSQHADILTGDDRRNTLSGGGGDDTIDGRGGNDVIRGGKGADTLTGGEGFDGLSYRKSSAGVTVDLRVDAHGKQSASGGDAQGDVVSGFERVLGSHHADFFTGDDGRNTLSGGDGDDLLVGGLGNDLLVGGGGFDSAWFSGSVHAYDVASLESGAIRISGPDGVDELRDVEAIRFVDFIYFTDGRNNDPVTGGEAVRVSADAPSLLDTLLDNDIDLDGDALSIMFVGPATSGGVVLNPDSSVLYTPGAAWGSLALGETGTDSFTYMVSDGRGGVRSETVDITITGVNDAVKLASPTYQSGFVTEPLEGAPPETLKTSGQISFTDADVTDTHNATWVPLAGDYVGSFSIGAPTTTSATTKGKVSWEFSVPDSALENLGENEVQTQGYRISIDDGNGSILERVVYVSITGTNETPKVIDGVVFLNNTWSFGNPVTFNAAAYFEDPNGDALAFSAENLPDGLSIDPVSGQVTGAPEITTAPGNTTVTFKATDTSAASVTWDVVFNLPDPTPNAVNDVFTLSVGNTLTGDLGLNDPTPRAQFVGTMIYDRTYSVTPGVVNAAPMPANSSLEINADGTFTFNADPNVFGSTQFSYTVTNAFGQTDTAIATINIAQKPVVAAGNGDLGVLAPAALDLTRDGYGRPTGPEGTVEVRLPNSQFLGFVTGDWSTQLDSLALSNVVRSGELAFITPGHPEGTVDGGDIVLSIPLSKLSLDGSTNDFSVGYGFPLGQRELNLTPNLTPGTPENDPFELISSGIGGAGLDFELGLTVVDDRSFYDTGPVGGVNPDYLRGYNGHVFVRASGAPQLALDGRDNFIVEISLELGTIVIGVVERIIYDWTNGPDAFLISDGTDAPDAETLTREIGGGDTALLLFGEDGQNAGDGGDGGDATDGTVGYFNFVTGANFLPVGGQRGADGGDGGNGADTRYTITGSSKDDIIIGGNGGHAGANGEDGADGARGAETPNPGIGQPAIGGEGGTGGSAGLGGSTHYEINGGAGDDEIYGGNPGYWWRADGSSTYVINGGTGNDTLHAGADLSNLANGNQSTYEMHGGEGNDTFVFENGQADRPHNAASFNKVMIDGGAGFDTLVLAGITRDYPENWYNLPADARMTGIERIRLLDGSNDDFFELELDPEDVRSLVPEVDGMHTLYLDVTGLTFGGFLISGWTPTLERHVVDGIEYHRLMDDDDTGVEVFASSPMAEEYLSYYEV